MAGPTRPYKYTPLQNESHMIRLIRLLPGQGSDTIHCELQAYLLENCPSYRALSYAWGDLSGTEAIFVEGCSMMITKNLYGALHQLRNDSDNLILWVDALCIDQSNVEERNHQVTQMRWVYGMAERVLVWLGESDAASDAAIEVLRNAERGDDRAKHKAACLLIRPWWSRMWVLQEVAAARQEPIVCCGSKVIPWTCFDNLKINTSNVRWTRLISITRQGVTDASKEAGSSALVKSKAHSQIFLALVRHLRDGGTLTGSQVCSLGLLMEASDRRDLVYGALSFLETDHKHSILPDYSKTILRVQCEATAHSILMERNLEILTLATSARNSPTWVPDCGYGVVGIFFEPGISCYSAAGLRTPRVEFSSDYTEMRAVGIVIDIVEKVADLESGNSAFPSSTRLAYEVGKRNGLSTEEIRCSFWRTIIGNQARAHKLASTDYPAPAEYRLRYMALQDEDMDVPSEFTGPEDVYQRRVEYIAPFWASVDAFHHYHQSKFFTTHSGRFGIGQWTVKPGDVACVLAGGKVVFLLRDQGDYQTLVGCAYVHNVMDGELAHLLDDDTKTRQFCIR